MASVDDALASNLAALVAFEAPAGYVALADTLFSLALYREAAISLICALSLDQSFGPAMDALDALTLAAKHRQIDFQLAADRCQLLPSEHGYVTAAPEAMEQLGLRLGHAFRDGGSVISAIGAYGFAVSAMPSHDNYFHLGHAYRRGGRLRAAVQAYRNGIDRDPTQPEGYFYCGEALEALHDLRGAMISFEEGYSRGLSAASEMWARLAAKLHETIFHVRWTSHPIEVDTPLTAVVRDENAETYGRLASELEKEGCLSEAVYACAAAITHRQADPAAEQLLRKVIDQHILAGKESILLQAGRQHVFSAALGFQPIATDVLESIALRLGHAFRDAGLFVPSIAAYRAAADVSTSPDTFFHLGHAYRRAGDHESAARAYVHGLDKGISAAGFFYLGEALDGVKADKLSVAAFTWAMAIDPTMIDARRNVDRLQRNIPEPARLEDLVVPIPLSDRGTVRRAIIRESASANESLPSGSFAWWTKRESYQRVGAGAMSPCCDLRLDDGGYTFRAQNGVSLAFEIIAPEKSRHVVKLLCSKPQTGQLRIFHRTLPNGEQQLAATLLPINDALCWVSVEIEKQVSRSYLDITVESTAGSASSGDIACIGIFTHPIGRNDIWGAFLEQIDYDSRLSDLRQRLRCR
ncbi:hypothetical protein N182_32885 [Sinorhizobium sp. GL2]|nr:hypothetical protein N182_32885 [Sinorhizobium sp. GL2]